MLTFVYEYDEENQSTWKGFDCTKRTAQELFDEYSLDSNVSDFTGHALALYLNDEYVLDITVVISHYACQCLLLDPHQTWFISLQLFDKACTGYGKAHKAVQRVFGQIWQVTLSLPIVWARRTATGLCKVCV